ncbi:MAG: molybdate ABC transporter substrate-binding protein, partial [Halarcobacter sp.]
MLKKILLVLVVFVISLNASNLKVAAGAGYKKSLLEVIKEYEKSGNKIDAFFGNMKQVTTQA